MDVVTMVGEGLRSVGVLDFFHAHSACADNLVLGKRERHVVDTEVGEKLGGRVKLMAIPCSMPPDSHFGEPLPAQNKVALPAGAGLRLRKFVVELNFELYEIV